LRGLHVLRVHHHLVSRLTLNVEMVDALKWGLRISHVNKVGYAQMVLFATRVIVKGKED